MRYIMIVFLLAGMLLIADPPEGYYDGTEGLMGAQLKSALHDIIDDHDEYSYNALRDYILPYTDQDVNNPDNVILLYSGWSRPIDDFGGGASEWNREHTWAKSHGDFGNNPPCGTDAHHIRPTDVTINSRRGNLDFDDGGTIYIDGDGNSGCYVDNDSWEPRDEVKGDIARMLFYMAVRYEGDSGEPDLEMADEVNTSPAPEHGKLSTLIEWHMQDQPDEWEMRRNDRVFEYQENRNPFIDHPEFVSRIWLNSSNDENLVSIEPVVSAYPNPFNPQTTISWSVSEENIDLKIFNLKGQCIKEFKSEDGTDSVVWDGDDNQGNPISSGIYLCKLYHNGRTIKSIKMMLMK